jgi:Pyruvate/2-oxoacid:ferredoxin oxidoreductase delta subunit
MPTRDVIKIDEEKCDGCGQCVIACAESALEVIDGKARLVSDIYCDGLGACLGECPQGALTITQREAEDFDEEAVKERVSEAPKNILTQGCPSSCPSSIPRSIAAQQTTGQPIPSQLTNWPIQLHLVNPAAPFFKGADLVIAADCSAFSYGAFHRDLLAGKKVVIACPKLDNPQGYVEKITDLVNQGGVESIEIVHMEVPCCFGLRRLVEIGASRAGRKVPIKETVVSIDGSIENRN